MGEHLFKNWIVYVMIGGFVWFVIYAYFTARKDEKKEKEQNKPQEKEQK